MAGIAASLGMSLEKARVLLTRDRRSKRNWEEVDRVGFEYNRLVLYDAQIFHCNGEPWGDTRETGRLTHNFFIGEPEISRK